MMKTYAVLLAPEFRLQATLRHRRPQITDCQPSPGCQRKEKPLALLEVQGTKPRVVELNAVAKTFQVQRGMTPTQAMARCAELELLQGNAGHERSSQQALLQIAESLSPFVESTAPGVVTVELPPERLFREEDFLTKAVQPLQQLGLEIRMGLAITPELALLAARFAEPVQIIKDATAFLSPLPMEALQPTAEMTAVLKSWGIHTIGQFNELPAAQIWERLGPEAVQLSERARGGRVRPLKLIKAQEFFSEEADLEYPVEMLEPLLFLLRRFLEQITVRLGQAYRVAGKLRLVLRFERHAPYRRVFTIPQPTREINLLFRMLHTHLENFTSESPIFGVELAAQPVRPTEEQFSLLDRGLRDPYQFAETLARVQALLGAGQVGTPEIRPSRHPEAFHLRPYRPTSAPAPVTNQEEFLLGVPWLLFRPSVPAKIILEGAKPAFLYSICSTGPIKDACGPWLLEGDWWEDHWSREEWDVATDDGIYRLVRIEGKWFLDGIYA